MQNKQIIAVVEKITQADIHNYDTVQLKNMLGCLRCVSRLLEKEINRRELEYHVYQCAN